MPLSPKPTIFIDLTGTLTGFATTFPTSPGDGDEIMVMVDTTPTVWNFRWLAQSSVWVFVGGPPMVAVVATAETTGSTAFTDLATVGPSITVPRTGSYLVGVFARMQNNTATDGSQVAPTSPTLGAAAIANGIRADSATAGAQYRISSQTVNVSLTAAEALKLQYSVVTGGTSTFSDRKITLLPASVT